MYIGTAWKVDPLTEHSLVIDFFHQEPDSRRKDAHQYVQVEEKRHPRCRLVFRHGSNDGNMDLRVACVPQGVKPTTPRSNVT